jgi:hypothetical protein
VLGEEGGHLTAHLQIGGGQHPFDTVGLPTHVIVEHIVDVQGPLGDNLRERVVPGQRPVQLAAVAGVGVKDALRGGHQYTDTEVDR